MPTPEKTATPSKAPKADAGDDVTTSETVESPAPPVVKAPAAPAKPAPHVTPAHHTRCVVTGTDVISMHRLHRAGDIADFPNSDVASLPDILVPVTE